MRQPLSESEALAIIQAASGLSWDARYNWRWQSFFRLLWYTGFRESEALAIAANNVGHGEIVFVPVKQREAQPLVQPVPVDLTDSLKALAVALNLKPSQRIFPWSARRVQQVMKECARRAEIARRVHPHLFRHSYAHRMARTVREGGYAPAQQVKVLQRLMHHRSSKSILPYLEATEEEIAEVVQRAFGSEP